MSINSAIREKPKRRGEVFFTGMALFCMFFGAGNLIFPLLIGKSALSQITPAILGLTISAVAFPFLGLMAMMFFHGNLNRFLERLGKWPAFILLLVLQITQGPLCMARLFTLCHSSLKAFVPGAPLLISTIAIGALVFFLTYRPSKIVGLLGNVLTPFLLLSLGVLILVGIIGAPPMAAASESAGFHFVQGVKGGYLTMDLISALLFATMIMPHLSRGTEDLSEEEAGRAIRKKMIKASLVAASLLTVTYIGLCLLSAHHGSEISTDVAPADLLQAIAVKILGPWGGYIAAITVFFACFTTAMALASIFGDYVRKDLLKDRISPMLGLVISIGLTTATANLGFSGILRLLGPILEILYPALIVLCLLNIAHCLYLVRPVKIPVFFALGFAAVGFCFG